jgi:hypothetical protein
MTTTNNILTAELTKLDNFRFSDIRERIAHWKKRRELNRRKSKVMENIRKAYILDSETVAFEHKMFQLARELVLINREQNT